MTGRSSNRGVAQESFVEFVRSRRPALVAAAAVILGDREEAEDRVQDALVKVAARWHQLEHESPEAYARRILFRDSVSWWRKVARRRRIDGTRAADSPAGPYDIAARTADKLLVADLLQNLSARQRAVLYLRYFEDLEERVIADMLGISQGSVKRHAHLGLNRLRNEYTNATEERTHGLARE